MGNGALRYRARPRLYGCLESALFPQAGKLLQEWINLTFMTFSFRICNQTKFDIP